MENHITALLSQDPPGEGETSPTCVMQLCKDGAWVKENMAKL